MKMKNLIIIPFFLLMATAVTAQEVSTVSVYSDYSMPGVKRIAVNKIDAVGGGIRVSFKIDDDSDLDLNFGYQLFSLQQDSALQRWNWDFWETRYKNRIAADLQADPRLAATINPIQKMDLYSVDLSFSHLIKLPAGFRIVPRIGGGVMFFIRRLYLEESWQKKFDASFTYEYSYRNFATNKTGNPYFANAGITLDYALVNDINLSAGAEFRHIFRTAGKFGYEQFVFNDALSINLGLTFVY